MVQMLLADMVGSATLRTWWGGGEGKLGCVI